MNPTENMQLVVRSAEEKNVNPKPTKKQIIEAMARALIMEREKKNVELAEAISKLNVSLAKLALPKMRPLLNKCIPNTVSGDGADFVNFETKEFYIGGAEKYVPGISFQIGMTIEELIELEPKIAEAHQQIKQLNQEQARVGSTVEWQVEDELKRRVQADPNAVVRLMLADDEMRAKLSEAAKDILKKPSPKEVATAIDVS